MKPTPLHILADPTFRRYLTYAFLLLSATTICLRLLGLDTLPYDTLLLPILFVTAAILVLRGQTSIHRSLVRTARERRIRSTHCITCNYDLRATPLRCPECGTKRAWSSPKAPTSEQIMNAAFTLILAASYVYVISFLTEIPPVRSAKRIKTQITQATLSNLETALESFKSDHGRYPTTAENLPALLTPPLPITTPYLKSLPPDAWGTSLLYANPTPTTHTLSSAGPDATPGTPDDILP